MTFLIARPAEKSVTTLKLFTDSGLQARSLPIIDVALSNEHGHISALNNSQASCIIVTSTYAANWLLHAYQNQQILLQLSALSFVCVGRATGKILQDVVCDANIHIASPENSEGILQSPCLQTVNKGHIVLLKGEGGRDLIASTLRQQNAKVIELCVYNRTTNAAAIRAFTFEPSEIRCIIATSIEITELLLANLSGPMLRACIWIVASERIKDYARQKGIQHIVVSQGASDTALLACANQLVTTGVVHD